MLKPHMPHERGFTIVEIMVTIGILALVTAIAIPVFINQKKKGKDSALETELMQTAAIVSEFSTKNSWNLLKDYMSYPTGEVYEKRISNTEWNTGVNDWENLRKQDAAKPENLKDPWVKLWLNLVKPLPINDGFKVDVIFSREPLPYGENNPANDFCLQGSKKGSSYEGTGGSVDSFLYWDQLQGKVMTAAELADAYLVAPNAVSCSDQARNNS